MKPGTCFAAVASVCLGALSAFAPQSIDVGGWKENSVDGIRPGKTILYVELYSQIVTDLTTESIVSPCHTTVRSYHKADIIDVQRDKKKAFDLAKEQNVSLATCVVQILDMRTFGINEINGRATVNFYEYAYLPRTKSKRFVDYVGYSSPPKEITTEQPLSPQIQSWLDEVSFMFRRMTDAHLSRQE